MKKILIILLGSLVFITSCETIVDDLPIDKLNLPKEKLVLNSLICPQDSMIYVKVTVSTPLFGDYKSGNTGYYVIGTDTTFLNKSNLVKDAIVTISSGSQSVVIPYQPQNEFYAISTKKFKIEAGKTYTLKASTKEHQAEATTTVPVDEVKIEYLKVDSTGILDFRKDTIQGYEIKFSWKDIPNQKNYYKMRGILEYFEETPKMRNNILIYETQKKFSTAYWWTQKEDLAKQGYLDDTDIENFMVNPPSGRILMFYSSTAFDSSGKLYKSKVSKLSKLLRVQLLNLSKDYYDFYYSVSKSNEADGNPFAEPVPVFTNVKNGLGCFASYNKSEIILSLK